MNHVFKVVKCRKTGGVKAVAEHARSGKKSKSLASLTLAIMAASGVAHAEVQSGVNAGHNDTAIGSQSISVGKDGIAIGAGAFTLPLGKDEDTTRQMVGQINTIQEETKALQQDIIDNSILELQYQATIDKVELAKARIAKEQAEVDRMKAELPADIKNLNEKMELWNQKQKEVTDKLTYLARLDLSKYQTFNKETVESVAKDVMAYAENGQNADNSLGLDFYVKYIDNYITMVATKDWILGHRSSAMSGDTVFNTETDERLNVARLLDLPIDNARDVGNFKIVSDSEIHTFTNEQFETKIKALKDSKTALKERGASVAKLMTENNWLLNKMAQDKKGGMADLPEIMVSLIDYRLADTEAQYLRKQLIGVASGTAEYQTKVSQIDNLMKEKEGHWQNISRLTGSSIPNIDASYANASFLNTLSRHLINPISSYAHSLTNPAIAANTTSVRAIRTYLERTFPEVTSAKDGAQIVVNRKEKDIQNSLELIESLQPTVEELAAYDRAVEVRTQINASRDALAAKLKRLNEIKTELSKGSGMLAIGSDAKSMAEYSTAIGAGSEVFGRDSVAIGKGASVSGNSSTAIGTGNIVTGDNSGAFGDPNTVVASNSYAFGNNNTISIGADDSFVTGNNSVVADNAINSVVLGSNSKSTASNTVALGNNSVADRANSVSVGSASAKRSIINVADGVQNTDAINLSQLNTKGELSVVNATKDKITSTASAVSEHSSVLAKQDASIKALATDKLDLSALKAASDKAIANEQAINSQATELDSLSDLLVDDAYIKAQNASLDQEIKKSQDAQDSLWQTSIAELEGVDKAIGNSIASTKTALDNIANQKADATYVDAKDKEQDSIIATKADKSYVDSKEAAQDALIAQKSNADDVKAIIDEHATQLDLKADENYVATQNSKQDEAIKNALAPFDDVDAGLQAQITSNDEDIADLYEVKADKSYVDAQNKSQDDAFTASVEQLKTADNTSDSKLQDLEREIAERDDVLAQSATEQTDEIKGIKDTTSTLAEQTKQIGDKLTEFELEFKANADDIRNKAEQANKDSIARDKELEGKIIANDNASKARDAEIDNTITVKNQESIERDTAIDNKLDSIHSDALARDNALQDRLDEVDNNSIARDEDMQHQITVNNNDSIARDEDMQHQITVNNNDSIARDNVIASNIDSNEKSSIDRDKAIEALLNQVDKNAKDSDLVINASVDANEAASIERDKAIFDVINSTDEQLQKADGQLASRIDSNHVFAEDALNSLADRIVETDNKSVGRDDALQAQIFDNSGAITALQEVDKQIKTDISSLEEQVGVNNKASITRDEQIQANADAINENSINRDDSLQASINNTAIDIEELKGVDNVLANNDEILDAQIQANHQASVNADLELTNKLSAIEEQASKEFSRLQAFNPVQDAVFREMQANQDAVIATKFGASDFLRFASQQYAFDTAQGQRIEQNRQGAERLDRQIKSIDKELSGAIASSIALSQMPTPTSRNDHYVTVGTGSFNGESALSVGFTGTNTKGNISYKIGGSWADGSGSTFGLGAGYYWK